MRQLLAMSSAIVEASNSICESLQDLRSAFREDGVSLSSGGGSDSCR